MIVHVVVENNALEGFRAEHGMAFHIETPAGHQILFDTGDSGDVILHNMARFGLDPGDLDAILLSHAHYDHTGGLEKLLPHCRPNIPLYAHPAIFHERYSADKDIGLRMSRAALEEQVTLHLVEDGVEIVDGVWLSGQIADRSYFEGRSANHTMVVDGERVPDPYVDDFSVVLYQQPGQIMVLLGCGHAGILNILAQVRRTFDEQIVAVAGGSHLISATDEMLKEAIIVLRDEYDSPRLYLGHCTGKKALATLRDALGEHMQPCPAGTVL